jgi:hypothetical protein
MNKFSSRLLVLSFALLLVSMNSFAQHGGHGHRGDDRRDDRRDHHRDERRDDRYEERYQDRYPHQYNQREKQLTAYSTLHLQVNQTILGRGTVHLAALIRQQYGAVMEGAQIDRVTVIGGVTHHRQAHLQLEINNRPAAMPKVLRRGQSMMQVDSREEIRSFQLEVMGDAFIQGVVVSVGMVRTQPQYPYPQYPSPSPYPTSIVVNKMVNAQNPLSLSSLLPYESRMVESLVIEAESRFNESELAALSDSGEFFGKVDIENHCTKKVLRLRRPIMLRNLNLHSFSPIKVEKIEINFAY